MGEKVPGGTSFAVQSIGHQNCHDAFAEELYEKLRSTEKSIGGASSDEGPTLVDISINGALADSAIVEGILASMQVWKCRSVCGFFPFVCFSPNPYARKYPLIPEDDALNCYATERWGSSSFRQPCI